MTDRDRAGPARPLLVFGGTGQVGRELIVALRDVGPVVAPTRAEANLEQPHTLREIIGTVRPSLIVNAAALTNVDQAERDRGLAKALNEVAPGVMAEEARRLGALMVHYSTDYVFDGDADRPYGEAATPHPINAYGMSKLAGERSVAAVDNPHIIVRTSWVYSATGAGFVPTFLRKMRQQREIRVVADQVGSPTWSRSLARATARIIESTRRRDSLELGRADWGVYHLGGGGAASRVDIAHEILAACPPSAGRVERVIIPVSAQEFGAVARRPRYSALSNDRTERRFDVVLDDWRTEIRRMLVDVRL